VSEERNLSGPLDQADVDDEIAQASPSDAERNNRGIEDHDQE